MIYRRSEDYSTCMPDVFEKCVYTFWAGSPVGWEAHFTARTSAALSPRQHRQGNLSRFGWNISCFGLGRCLWVLRDFRDMLMWFWFPFCLKPGFRGRLIKLINLAQEKPTKEKGLLEWDLVFVGNNAESNRYLHEFAMYLYILDKWTGLNKPRVLTKTFNLYAESWKRCQIPTTEIGEVWTRSSDMVPLSFSPRYRFVPGGRGGASATAAKWLFLGMWSIVI